MKERSFNEMIAYFNRRVSEMDIAQDYKIELLGMVTALGYKHEKTAQPEIIRCKDCKYKKVYCFPPKYYERDYCVKHEKTVDVADFCSWAERRTDE